METKTSLILVIGGTGTQGGNVARELLKHRHRIRVLSRDPESPAAQKLARKGAEIVKGDLGDVQSLESVMEGVTAIFSAQYADPYDPSIEPRNASNMIRAALNSGVQQIVHTSVVGSNMFPRWDKYLSLVEYWEHKYEIEEFVRNSGFHYWTNLHPCWFMENLATPSAGFMAPELKKGVLFGVLGTDTPIKLNCGEDTAKFARAAFENPDLFNGKDINVAGDERSMSQIADILSKALDKKVVYEEVSHEEAVKRGLHEGTVFGQEWMNAIPGYGFDIKETKQYEIPLISLEQWVNENKDRIDIDHP